MKTYFVKTLPVTTEPKLGELCIFQGRMETYTEYHWREWCQNIKDEKQQTIFALGLVLCSKDIKVGDTIKAGKGMNMELHVGLTNNKMTYHVIEQTGPSKGLYHPIAYAPSAYPEAVKILGRISSKAMWVKEGNEFDEDEIQIAKICHDDSTPPYDSYCSYCSRSMECGNDEGNEVFIKGPCGHFH